MAIPRPRCRGPRVDTLAPCISGSRSRVEVALARGAGRLSRLARAGGGTTFPGKLLTRLDPAALERLSARLARRLRARLGDERQDDDRVDGRGDPRPARAAGAQQLGREPRLGRRLRPCSRRNGAELGLFEVDEAALPEVARRVRPARASASATCSATSSTATASSSTWPRAGGRWRRPGPGLHAGRERRRPAGRRPCPRAAGLAGVRPRRPPARAAGPPARRRLEVVHPVRDAVRVRGRLRRPPGRLPLPARAGTHGRRSTSRRASSS